MLCAYEVYVKMPSYVMLHAYDIFVEMSCAQVSFPSPLPTRETSPTSSGGGRGASRGHPPPPPMLKRFALITIAAISLFNIVAPVFGLPYAQ
jgi:hypothetical protein